MVDGEEKGPSGRTLRKRRWRERRANRPPPGLDAPVTTEEAARDRAEGSREHMRQTTRDGVPFR